MEIISLISVIAAILLLLLLVIRFKIPAFLALLVSCFVVGLLVGHPLEQIFTSIQTGVGNTLGFVAVVIGLGALLGGFLEATGGAEVLAQKCLVFFGEQKASWALLISGFLIAIPVFFDVAFIILIPVVYSLQRKSGKSILVYALPLLAGLAITHAFIPPTPGPVAVAQILNASVGWVIIFGFLVGIPTALVSGIVFPNFIGSKIFVTAPKLFEDKPSVNPPKLGHVLLIIGWPLGWIVLATCLNSTGFEHHLPENLQLTIQLMGHPFGALLSANFVAWILFRSHYQLDSSKLLEISNQSLQPVGLIILLTAAGGAFKQLLIDTQTGTMITNLVHSNGISILLFAFIVAVLLRLIQGSATVAMITAAGLTAPLLNDGISEPKKALIVIAIAAGSSIFSHVNDSGFWLVSKYLGLNEKDTLRSWSLMTLILSLTGFLMVGLISLWVS